MSEFVKLLWGRLEGLYTAYSPNEWLWLVSYSGGKDSTSLLLLVLTYAAHKGFEVGVVYNDAGGDLPELRKLVFDVLNSIRSCPELSRALGKVFITRPDKTFFDYLLMGYSPPRWNFRWCCKRLKEQPFKRLLRELAEGGKVLNLVGNRREEARWRNWFIKRINENIAYVAPLYDLRGSDVWNLLKELTDELGLRWIYTRLLELYRGGSVRRSGCWFCTLANPHDALILRPELLKIKLEVLDAWCGGRREHILELARKHPTLIRITVKSGYVSHDYPCKKRCSICQVNKLRSALKKLID